MSDNKFEKSSSPAAAPPAGSRPRRCRSSSGKLLDITLVESEEIGTIGVGESTVPPIRIFHQLLGIDEQEFMRAVAATFKLGIWFENWGQIGDRYIHPFGRHGKPTWLCEFHHFWLHGLRRGMNAELGEYCVEWLAAKQGKFATSPQSGDQLRVSHRRRALREVPAQVRRGLRRQARRRQDPVGAAERDDRLHRIADAGFGPGRSPATCSSIAPASAAC